MGIQFTKMNYKLQSEKLIKDNGDVGKLLRNLVLVENMLVTNEKQFRSFYKQFTTHELIGGTKDDLNIMKIQIAKDLLTDLINRIDDRGFYHENENDVQQTVVQ